MSEGPFYDPTKVPEGLKADWSEMQADYTKKTQAVAADKRSVETQLQQLRGQTGKAQAFDEIMRDPDVFSLVQQKARGQAPASSPDDADLDPSIREELNRQIGPLRQELQQTQARLADQQDAAEFARTHPDADKLREPMQEVWREDQLAGKPLRTREAAYDAAFRRTVLARRDAATRQQARKAASVEGTGTQKRTPTPTPSADSFEEAVELAAKELRIDLNKLS
jgi:peptidoglycan hydrolase CwlO-like protein